MQFDALEKSVMRLQIKPFKNGHQYTKTNEDKNFIF